MLRTDENVLYEPASVVSKMAARWFLPPALQVGRFSPDLQRFKQWFGAAPHQEVHGTAEHRCQIAQLPAMLLYSQQTNVSSDAPLLYSNLS